MPNKLEEHIAILFTRAALEIAAAVREDLTAQIVGMLAPSSAGAGKGAAGHLLPRAVPHAVPHAAPKAAPTKHKGRKPAAAIVETVRSAAPAKLKTKRAWPKCTHAGCPKNAFGPSGDKKLCYEHYKKAGGKHYRAK